MKISGSKTEAGAVGGSTGILPAGKAGSAPGAAVTSVATDRVQLSSLAQFAAAYSDSPVHIAKLSALNATVSSGRYQVDAGVLSNSLIEASMTLSGSLAL